MSAVFPTAVSPTVTTVTSGARATLPLSLPAINPHSNSPQCHFSVHSCSIKSAKRKVHQHEDELLNCHQVQPERLLIDQQEGRYHWKIAQRREKWLPSLLSQQAPVDCTSPRHCPDPADNPTPLSPSPSFCPLRRIFAHLLRYA